MESDACVLAWMERASSLDARGLAGFSPCRLPSLVTL